MTTPLVVTATLDTPSVGLIERPVMLDGPLAWAAAMAARAGGHPIDPITPDRAPDLALPLARWEQAGTWGWCTSQASLDVTAYTATEIRRRPATGPMTRYTGERKHHTGLGPYKARDVTVAAAWVRSATWHVRATRRDALEDLLALITHLGKHSNIGHGHVAAWHVEPDPVPDAWRDRPLPVIGAPRQAYRPPYHHPTRQIEVTA